MQKLRLITFILFITVSPLLATQIDEAHQAFQKKDYQQAFVIWEENAKTGNTGAHIRLAYLYTQGLGVDKNGDQAIFWLNEAVKLGSAEAEYQLAKLYSTGKLTSQDYTQSFNWYMKAAAKDHVDAQYQIAVIYFKGLNKDIDYETAYAWMSLAAEKDHKAASNFKEMIASVLDAEELLEAKNLAQELSRKYNKKN